MPRKTFRKIITNPDTIEQINPDNQKLVDRFLRNFDTKRSDKSVVVYRSNFNIFFCWNVLENDNKFFVDIKKMDFMDFFDYAVSELKWSPNRYAQMWSSLNSLSSFIENILDDQYPDFRNQVKKIEKLPKNTVREKTVLSEKQVDNLMQYLINEHRVQEACFLSLAINSGARISELFRFTIDLIDEENTAFEDLFLETTKEIKTKGFGKQGKLKYKYIIKDAFLPYYHEWLPFRKDILAKNEQRHSSLFIKVNGEPADENTSETWIRSWEQFLKNDEETNPEHEDVHIYPHCLRHYFVTHLSRLGLEEELIVALVGWGGASGGGEAMFHIYCDLRPGEKKFKGLDKLKTVLNKPDEL